LHPLFHFSLANGSSAFELSQMVLNIFECGVIGKILNKRESLPLCCFHRSLLGRYFATIPSPLLVANDSSYLQTGDTADAEIISRAILKNRLDDTATID